MISLKNIRAIFLFSIMLSGISLKVNSQEFNPSYSIGTVSGKYNFSYNQVPDDQLVEIHPPGLISLFFFYQWESSLTPLPANDADWTIISTQANYSFSAPLTQTTYFRRKVTGPGNIGYVYSNTIKINVVSTNWEDINYIREHDVITTGIADWQTVDQLPIGQKLQTTSYLDGLGRSQEKVSRETATPSTTNGTWGDMVQFAQYDVLGRQQKKYLPYTTTSESGKYKTAPLTEQPQYYTSTYNETAAFSFISFDNSPLNRVTNVKEPGTAWAASAGNAAAYDVNTVADNVQIFSVDYIQGNAPVNKGTYPSNTLYKLTYTDVNGKQVVEYSNKSGQLILKKIQLDDAPSAAHAGWICTYSIYDDFGLLKYQLQPEAVKYLNDNNWSFAGANGQQVLNELCFHYDYDDKGRTVWKKAPGAQPLKMLYDNRDRVVFMQDGNQAALPTPQWTTNLYDDLDRTVITTLYNTSASIASLNTDIANAQMAQSGSQIPAQAITNLAIDHRQTNISRYAATTSIEFLPGFESSAGEEFVAEIDPSAATPTQTITATVQNPIAPANFTNPAVCTIVKYLFYDDYSFATAKPFDNNFTNTTAYPNGDPNVLPITASQRTINMATGSLTRVLGTNTFLGNTAYYDEKGHAIQTQEENIKSGTDITTLQYHFDGRVLSSCLDHSAPGTGYSHFKTLTKNEFDKIGRVKTINKQFGTNSFIAVSAYDYDDMGRLKSKNLDPDYLWYNGFSGGLESLEYSYNIHNQVTGINKDMALKTPGKYYKFIHYFGMYLGFDNRDNVFNHAQLNGQVGGQLWYTLGDDAQRRYDYTYDNAGRLINAAFTEKQHPGDNWSNAKMDFSVSGSSGQITYDLNGNLLSMLQKGVMPGTATPITIDDLHYTYTSFSNKLQSVTDVMTTPTQNGVSGDFKDGANGAGTPDYVYDNNGNLVVDLNKNAKDLNNVAGANGISYNFLDKPEQIRIAGKGTIKIVYSADGEKLQRVYTPENGGNAVTTTYVNGFVYQSTAGGADALSYFNFEEGRVRVITPVANSVSYPVSYEQDHADYLYISGDYFYLPDGKHGALDYFIRDYQQNVRVILTDEQHTASNTCTMETTRTSVEVPVFGQTGAGNEVEATRYATPAGWQSTNATGYVSRLGNIAGHNIGPNVLQKVMAGDNVAARTVYYYQPGTGGSSPNFVNTLLATLGQALGGNISSGTLTHNNVANITSQLNGSQAFLNAVQPAGSGGTTPKAYLTMLFFDERFNLVPEADGGVVQIQVYASYNGTGTPLVRSTLAPKNGYVYAYVSNQSDQDVYFDDFQVTIERGKLLEENSYYAHGLKIAAISSHVMADPAEGAVKNNYLYNDKELFDDGDLNWYDYGFRNYDPQIGRFVQLDPLTDDYPELTPYQYASNDPITNIDIDGLEGGTAVVTGFKDGVQTADAFHNALSEVVVTAVRHTKTVARVGATTIGSVAVKALDIATDFIPIVSGAKDIYQGVRDGNWLQAGLGALSVVADVFTLGGSSLAKGAIKTVVKEGVEILAKDAVEQVAKNEAEQIIKREVKHVAEKIPCGCFTAGTLVLTDKGYKKIEEIKPGDIVLAYNDTTHAYGRKKVVKVFEHVRDTVYVVHIGEEIINTTSDHPFFVGGRWLRVIQLHVGDSVVTYSGNKIAISAIEIIAKRSTVHNFEVADYHTYYVSGQKVLVHNSVPCEIKKLIKQAEKEYPNKIGKSEKHHIEPKYLGGPANGPTKSIPAPYHQKITNAFNAIVRHGNGPVSATQRKIIMQKVYKKFPIKYFP